MLKRPLRPAARTTSTTDPQDPQGNNPSQQYYIKISKNNAEKSIINWCRCWSCDLVKDFNIQYYDNPSILLDNDRSIHIAKTVD